MRPKPTGVAWGQAVSFAWSDLEVDAFQSLVLFFAFFPVSLGDIVHHKNFIHFKNLIFLPFVLLYYSINTVIWYYNFVNLFLAQKKLSHFLTSGKAYNIKL